MKNTIDAQVEFSFRGECHSPTITLDLDSLSVTAETFQALHTVIATRNGIDTYSYLYDAMESCPIVFSNPQGLAVDYLQDNIFDFLGYEKKNNENNLVKQVSQVAQELMGVDDLDGQPELKAALIAAYELGVVSKI